LISIFTLNLKPSLSKAFIMENRYLTRFKKNPAVTAKAIANLDASGNVADRFNDAKASLAAQERNVQMLFSTAVEMITSVNTFQDMTGHQFVENIPLPNDEIKQSPGKQLGYVQLTMRFLQAGVTHFMEEKINDRDRIDELEKHIAKVAEYDEDIPLLGEMQEISISQLEGYTPPASPQTVQKDTKTSITIPPSPTEDKMKSATTPPKVEKKKTESTKRQK
jgi:hypothetical protein